MNDHQPCLGAHLSAAGGIHNAIQLARNLECNCLQLFVTNQRQWRRSPLTEEAAENFRHARAQNPLAPVVVHGGYLINLAAADPKTLELSRSTFADEYDRSTRIAADYYVLHPGAHKDQGVDTGIELVAKAIRPVLEKTPDSPTRLLLEATAGQGTALGHRFEHLRDLIDQIELPGRVGVCLDTAHLFAAGYDIRTPESFNATLEEFHRIVGLDALALIHCNDSKTALASHVDRHEHIGQGKLGNETFRLLLTDPRTRSLPFILETPKGTTPDGVDFDAINLERLRTLARS